MVELHSHPVSRTDCLARSSVFKAVRLRANKNPNDAAAVRRCLCYWNGQSSLTHPPFPSFTDNCPVKIKFRLHGKAAIKRKLWLQTLTQRNVQSYFVRYWWSPIQCHISWHNVRIFCLCDFSCDLMRIRFWPRVMIRSFVLPRSPEACLRDYKLTFPPPLRHDFFGSIKIACSKDFLLPEIISFDTGGRSCV